MTGERGTRTVRHQSPGGSTVSPEGAVVGKDADAATFAPDGRPARVSRLRGG
jgi:hypothetical protein